MPTIHYLTRCSSQRTLREKPPPTMALDPRNLALQMDGKMPPLSPDPLCKSSADPASPHPSITLLPQSPADGQQQAVGHAPDAWPETWTKIPLNCPVCGSPSTPDHYLDCTRGPGWKCSTGGYLHYWMVRAEPLRRWLAAHPPPPRYPWYDTPPDERRAWLEAHARPPDLAPSNQERTKTPMHWTERRRVITSIGEELRRRGWTLYGWKEDRSDAMTDYYAPASWDGVAEKDGYVAVVDVSKSNSFVLSRSGGHQTQQRVPGEACPHCQGSGKEPDGWTFERAKANPVEFNRSWTKGGVALLPTVVSPLMFDGEGDQKCTACQGVGHGWRLEPVTEPWPTFQANAPGRLWHVERDGRILASGVGLGPCADYDAKRAQAAVEQLVDRIERATRAPSAGQNNGNHNGDTAVTIRHNESRNGIEVVFSSKPDVDVRTALKGLGFRWSQNQGLWWSRFSPRVWERVHDLLRQEPSAPLQSQTPEFPQPEPEPEVLDDPFGPQVPRYVIDEPLTGQIIGGNEPATPSEPEPWQMTRLAFQESRALRVAGVPILNAADGRTHEAAVRQAAAQGLPVPPHVLAYYGLSSPVADNRACSPADTLSAQSGEHGNCFPAWEQLLATRSRS